MGISGEARRRFGWRETNGRKAKQHYKVFVEKIENGEVSKERPRKLGCEWERLAEEAPPAPKSILKSAKKKSRAPQTRDAEERPRALRRPRARGGDPRKSVSFKETRKRKRRADSRPALGGAGRRGRGKRTLARQSASGGAPQSRRDLWRAPAERECAEEAKAQRSRKGNSSAKSRRSTLRRSKCFKCGDLEKLGQPLPKRELIRTMSKGRFARAKRAKLRRQKENFRKYTFRLNKRAPSAKQWGSAKKPGAPARAQKRERSSLCGALQSSKTPTGADLIEEYNRLVGELDAELRALKPKGSSPEGGQKKLLLDARPQQSTWGIQTVFRKSFIAAIETEAKTLHFPCEARREPGLDARVVHSEQKSRLQGKEAREEAATFDLTQVKLGQSRTSEGSRHVRTITRNTLVDLGLYHDLNFL